MVKIKEALKLIFDGIKILTTEYPKRNFTIDGRLVGDIGEIIAETFYDVRLDEISQPTHDGVTSDGKKVQIKATFKNHLTFKKIPDYYLGLKLNEDGAFEEIYNGPSKKIIEKYGSRKGFGEELLSFPINDLKEMSKTINGNDRIKKRN